MTGDIRNLGRLYRQDEYSLYFRLLPGLIKIPNVLDPGNSLNRAAAADAERGGAGYAE